MKFKDKPTKNNGDNRAELAEAGGKRLVLDEHPSGPARLLESLKCLRGSALSGALAIRHPGMLQTLGRPLAMPPGEPGTLLRPDSELVSDPFGWPEKAYSADNCVMQRYGTEPWIGLKAGDTAVDFSLCNETGKLCRLGDYLNSAPVMLTFGMYSCPAYQMSKAAEIRLARTHHQQVHFVHLYTIDPHPKGSNNPDLGKPWELMYSKYPQACDYRARLEMCRHILADLPACIEVLIDALPAARNSGAPAVNPVWATYGPAPRPAFLIRQDGILDTSQLWLNQRHMSKAIRQLLEESA